MSRTDRFPPQPPPVQYPGQSSYPPSAAPPPAQYPGQSSPPPPVAGRPPAQFPAQSSLPPPAGPPPSSIQAEPLPPPPGATSAPLDQGARLTPPGANPTPPQPVDTSPPPDDTVITEMPTQKIENSRAVFSGLDKITGRIITFDAAIGETVQFGALQVTARVLLHAATDRGDQHRCVRPGGRSNAAGRGQAHLFGLDVRRQSGPARRRASDLRCLADRLRFADQGRRTGHAARAGGGCSSARALPHSPSRASAPAAGARRSSTAAIRQIRPGQGVRARRCRKSADRARARRNFLRLPARHRAACGRRGEKPRWRRTCADAR